MADENDFEMIPVVSSQLAAVGYKAETREMRVEFSNGSLYSYSGIPEEVYQELMSSPSAGSYFHAAVRNGGFPYQRLS